MLLRIFINYSSETTAMKFLYIFVIVSVLFNPRVLSQGIEDLDAKAGFKDFTLGDSFEKWSDYVTISKRDGDVITCRYIGTCCNKVFDFPVDQIELKFKNNILFNILIQLANFQDFYNIETTIFNSKGYNELNSKFKILFGPESFTKMPENMSPIYIITGWVSDKVVLGTYYCYIGTREGDYALVNISSLDAHIEKLKEGF